MFFVVVFLSILICKKKTKILNLQHFRKQRRSHTALHNIHVFFFSEVDCSFSDITVFFNMMLLGFLHLSCQTAEI